MPRHAATGRYTAMVEPKTERAADRAYLLLRREIIGGGIPAGSHLAEADRATQYGLSRTPIRESLRRLQSEGLVEVEPHRGARVVDWNSFDIEGIYDLRALIEGFVARRAADRLTDAELTDLAELCDRMESLTAHGSLADAEVMSDFAQLNELFHGGIAEAAGADYVIPARSMLVVLPVILQALHSYATVDFERSNRHHRELLSAFRSKDAEWASSVMTSHVLSSKRRLMEAIRDKGNESAAVMELPPPKTSADQVSA